MFFFHNSLLQCSVQWGKVLEDILHQIASFLCLIDIWVTPSLSWVFRYILFATALKVLVHLSFQTSYCPERFWPRTDYLWFYFTLFGPTLMHRINTVIQSVQQQLVGQNTWEGHYESSGPHLHNSFNTDMCQHLFSNTQGSLSSQRLSKSMIRCIMHCTGCWHSVHHASHSSNKWDTSSTFPDWRS